MTFTEIKKAHEAANMIAGCYAKDDLYETLCEAIVREAELIRLLEACVIYVKGMEVVYADCGQPTRAKIARELINQLTDKSDACHDDMVEYGKGLLKPAIGEV